MYQFLYAMPYIDIRGWGWGLSLMMFRRSEKLWNSKLYEFIYLFIHLFALYL